jgi:hypothetical protein
MRSSVKWKTVLLALSMMPILGTTCSTAFRDAIQSGALDFVSGTVSEILDRTLPVAETVVPAAKE